ncbi:MAG: hypothetical protein PUC44_03470 [Eubacteriales bacterium]|nr:hypothetical protein [Eubacteriales bacterium]
MSREWQQTRFRELVMPDTVYYQSIWAVRDLVRMEKRLALIRSGSGKTAANTETAPGRNLSSEEEQVAEGMAEYANAGLKGDPERETRILERRIHAIRAALGDVPPMYRAFLLDNIILKKNESCFPNKLWRVWKQRFLYNVAKNLELI